MTQLEKQRPEDPAERLRVLGKFYNSGLSSYQQGDVEEANKAWQEGLALAKRWLPERELDAGLREAILTLSCNAGVFAGEQQRPEEEATHYQEGLQWTRVWQPAKITEPGLREAILSLSCIAGLFAGEQQRPEEVATRYQEGLQWARAWQPAEIAEPGLREAILTLSRSAGVFAGEQQRPEEKAARYQEGLQWARAWQPAEIAEPGLREAILTLSRSMWVHCHNQGKISLARKEALHLLALSWQFADSFSDFEQEVIDRFQEAYTAQTNHFQHISLATFQQHWSQFLEDWLLHHYNPEQTARDPQQRQWLLRLYQGLWYTRRISDNDDFLHLFEQAQHALQVAVARITAYQQAKAQYHHAWQSYKQNQKRLAGGWWRPFRYPQAWFALRWYAAPQRPVMAPGLTEGKPLYKNLATWLAHAQEPQQALPGPLQTPNGVLLGALWDHQVQAQLAALPILNVQANQTEKDQQAEKARQIEEVKQAVTCQWQQQTPWQDTALFSQLLTDYGWPTRADKTLATFARGTRHLALDYGVLNRHDVSLATRLQDYSQGRAQPLLAGLAEAWAEAKEITQCLTTLLTTLLQPKTDPVTKDVPKTDSATTDAPKIDLIIKDIPQKVLAAALSGQTLPCLIQAIEDYLHQHFPLQGEPEQAALQLKRAFSYITNRHPGPNEAQRLTQGINALCRQTLGDLLRMTTPKPAQLWQTLEQARIVLIGAPLHTPDVSADWQQVTAKKVLQTLRASFSLPHGHSPLPWLPLRTWLQRVETLRPVLPSPTDCQTRLRPDEALVQLYFNPNTGDLEALWLLSQDPLQRRLFADATQIQHWEGEQGILATWQQWLAHVGNINWRSAPTLRANWDQVFRNSSVLAVANTLQAWAKAAACQRLIVLFPSALAQLPWETLAHFQPDTLMLERPVSLSHWRAQANHKKLPHTLQNRRVFGDPEAKLRLVTEETRQAAQALNSESWLGPALTSFDLLSCLTQQGHRHCIVHGSFKEQNPWQSYFQVKEERLQAWLLPAAGIPGGRVHASACHSLRTGLAVQDILGVIGIGPALIAAGAEQVVGPLWKVHQLASWVFYQEFYALCAQSPQQALPQTVHLACQRLRILPRQELQRRICAKRPGGLSVAQLIEYFPDVLEDFSCQAHATQAIDPNDCPFDHPAYWAGFLLLGDYGDSL